MSGRFKATFQQSVEGIETVEVTVTADDFDHAIMLIADGKYERYRVTNHDFARIKQLGTLDVEQVD